MKAVIKQTNPADGICPETPPSVYMRLSTNGLVGINLREGLGHRGATEIARGKTLANIGISAC